MKPRILLAGITLSVILPLMPVLAQDDPAADVATAAPVLSEDTLDELVAPVALYPDALLAQVFVAATYPLDVIKAERWVEDAQDIEGDARTAAAEQEGWDPSVAVLAAGFPTVIERMAAEVDWTEQLGDALLVQTEDVLDAVQRQRARAQAVGNLETNDAQTVVVEDQAITIAPADPEVIYVPAYDPALAYTQTAPAAPMVYAEPDDPGYSGGEMIATGVIAFGAGMLVNEVFDDDDWDDYWRGPRHFDWDDDRFYPTPAGGGIAVGGDVNIDIDRNRATALNVDRDRVTEIDRDAWQPDRARRDEAQQKLARRESTGREGQARAALQDREQGDRAAMKSKLQARGADGGAALAKRPSGAGDRSAALKAAAEKQKARPKEGAFKAKAKGLSAAKDASKRGKLSAAKASGDKPRAAKPGGRAKLAKGSGGKKAALGAKAGSRSSAFKKGGHDGASAKKAAARGKKSGGGKLRAGRR